MADVRIRRGEIKGIAEEQHKCGCIHEDAEGINEHECNGKCDCEDGSCEWHDDDD